MVSLRFVFAIFFIFFYNVSPSCGLVETVTDVLHIGREVATAVLKGWDVLEASHINEQITLPIQREKQKKVLKRLAVLSQQIQSAENRQEHVATWTIDSIKSSLHISLEMQWKLHEINIIMSEISARFKFMQNLVSNKDKLEEDTLLKFSDWTVSPNSYSVHHQLERLSIVFLGSDDGRRSKSNDLLSIIANNIKDAREQVCFTQQSAQQFLFALYNDISLSELKGYAMMQFSWMVLRLYGRGNYTEEANIMRNVFEERSLKAHKILRSVMERAERTVWRCDPNKHELGKTYDEVTRLLQGYVENEVDMNPESTCRETCDFYSVTKSYGCFKDLYCSRQPKCSGRIFDCKYIDSDMWICPASLSSIRRYEYIRYEDGKVLGKDDKCVRGTTKVDSWWRWLFWHCSYCFCMCDETGPKSDRYFSLRPAISTTSENMIVTGVRFQKVNRIFHLQIQEGRLEKSGIISGNSLRWKPIDEFNILDANVHKDKDFVEMAWDKRDIDIDDLHGNGSQIVTGVKLRTVGTHLNLEIRLTEFNFETGELIQPELSFWVSNDNTELSTIKRTRINIKQPDISIRSLAKSKIISTNNQYIEFTSTDMYKDAAQTTVPFIDIQDVVSKPPVPLSGIGIYYKGQEGYGGFLAPRIFSYNIAPHIETPSFSKK